MSTARPKTWIAAILVTAATATAGPAPFTEHFATDPAGWRESTGNSDLNWIDTGGPDSSSYASGTFNFQSNAPGDTPTIFRAQDEYGSSTNAFEGNWLGGVDNFSASVRHDANVPLTFFTRFSGPQNFPGAIALSFIPVLPHTWTPISFDINAANPQFISFEGSSFEAVFGNVGHIQIGVSTPEALAGVDQAFTFDLDQPAITPEPATLALAAIGIASLGLRRRSRRSKGPRS